MLQGKYFSVKLATVDAEDDLIAIAKTLTGIDSIVVKKLTLISDGLIKIDVNNLGVYSDLYLDSDDKYKLSLDANDCVVTSLVVEDASVVPLFLAIIF